MCFWKCHLNVLGSGPLAHAVYFEVSVSQYLWRWEKNDILASSQSLSNPKCNQFHLSRLDPKSDKFKWNNKNKNKISWGVHSSYRNISTTSSKSLMQISPPGVWFFFFYILRKTPEPQAILFNKQLQKTEIKFFLRNVYECSGERTSPVTCCTSVIAVSFA